MTADGNSRIDKSADIFQLIQTALEFHGIRARCQQMPCARDGLGRRVIGMDWKIRDNQGVWGSASHHLRVVGDLGERDRGRVRLSADHHPEGVSHEQQLHSRLFAQAGRRVIIGRDRHHGSPKAIGEGMGGKNLHGEKSGNGRGGARKTANKL
jgi:hypothetical protein